MPARSPGPGRAGAAPARPRRRLSHASHVARLTRRTPHTASPTATRQDAQTAAPPGPRSPGPAVRSVRHQDAPPPLGPHPATGRTRRISSHHGPGPVSTSHQPSHPGPAWSSVRRGCGTLDSGPLTIASWRRPYGRPAGARCGAAKGRAGVRNRPRTGTAERIPRGVTRACAVRVDTRRQGGKGGTSRFPGAWIRSVSSTGTQTPYTTLKMSRRPSHATYAKRTKHTTHTKTYTTPYATKKKHRKRQAAPIGRAGQTGRTDRTGYTRRTRRTGTTGSPTGRIGNRPARSYILNRAGAPDGSCKIGSMSRPERTGTTARAERTDRASRSDTSRQSNRADPLGNRTTKTDQ